MIPRSNNGVYLLDTSALLAYLGDEQGAQTVEALLQAARKGQCKVLLSFLSMQEACSEAWMREGEEAARLLYGRLIGLPVERIGPSDQILWLACEIKTTRPVSVAESWIFAAAKQHQATLVHKDPALERIPDLVPLLAL